MELQKYFETSFIVSCLQMTYYDVIAFYNSGGTISIAIETVKMSS